mmetsp:Transcript_84247/g.192122  ORF Transcript_84247/g.192122 Transcript_84247/m.192122 type:complete len:355 (-) Transcript_84247:1710-2774(-)
MASRCPSKSQRQTAAPDDGDVPLTRAQEVQSVIKQQDRGMQRPTEVRRASEFVLKSHRRTSPRMSKLAALAPSTERLTPAMDASWLLRITTSPRSVLHPSTCPSAPPASTTPLLCMHTAVTSASNSSNASNGFKPFSDVCQTRTVWSSLPETRVDPHMAKQVTVSSWRRCPCVTRPAVIENKQTFPSTPPMASRSGASTTHRADNGIDDKEKFLRSAAVGDPSSSVGYFTTRRQPSSPTEQMLSPATATPVTCPAHCNERDAHTRRRPNTSTRAPPAPRGGGGGGVGASGGASSAVKLSAATYHGWAMDSSLRSFSKGHLGMTRRAGCGSKNNCLGTWPNSRTWASRTCTGNSP